MKSRIHLLDRIKKVRAKYMIDIFIDRCLTYLQNSIFNGCKRVWSERAYKD
jgi:hypothetical protein